METMTVRSYIETRLAPRLQGDGGWVEFASPEENTADIVLRFRGECSKCAMLDRCARWMEAEILRDLGKAVTILPERKKPFFWDNE